ncbi:MAG: hypothetical protein QOF22_2145, partial [Bradyrhizobium sp.]|nr:hypothetical protein [Bradyrhizobium sp.]
MRAASTIADVTNKRLREDAHGHKRSLHARKSALAIWHKLLTNQLDQPPVTEALKRASVEGAVAAGAIFCHVDKERHFKHGRRTR